MHQIHRITGTLILVATLVTSSNAQAQQLIAASDPEQEVEMTTLNFVDMDAFSIFEVLEEMTGKIILRQQSVPPVKINFNSRGPIAKEDAILALESLLTLNGIMLSDMGDKFVKAVPMGNPNAQVPELLLKSTLNLAPSQKIYAKLFKLEYLTSEEAGRLVTPLLSQSNGILDLAKSNTLLITDSLINLQRVEEILKDADEAQDLRSQMQFIRLEFVSAEDMQKQLESLKDGPLKTYFEGNTYIEADARTNQLILSAPKKNAEVIREIIKSLDIDAAPLTGSEVFALRYAKAEEVVPLIEAVISGQEKAQEDQARQQGSNPNENRPGNERGNPPAQNNAAPQLPTPAATPAAAPSGGTESSASLQFSDFVGLSPDERTNSIVAFGTTSDIRVIGDLIKKIDRPLPQVRIEAIITQVTLGENQSRGIDNFQLNYDGTGVFDGSISGGDGAGQFIVDGRAMSLIIGTAESDSAVRVLSTPVVVVSHNQPASINVSESRPIITQSQSSSEGVSINNSIEFRDIGIQLEVLPLIGADGIVQMEITQTIESVLREVQINNQSQPVIGKREAESYISVRDGDIVVLGGLQDNRQELSKGRLFGLQHIPIVRGLFGSRSREYNRTELIIFIQPTILTDPDDASSDARSQLDVAEARGEINNYISERTLGNTYVEPSRVPGLVEQREEEVKKHEAEQAREAEQNAKRDAIEAEHEAKKQEGKVDSRHLFHIDL